MKERAKELLKQQKSNYITFLFLLSTTGLSVLLSFFVPDIFSALLSMDMEKVNQALNWGGGIGLFLSLLLVLFSTVMRFGYRYWALRVAKVETASAGSLLQGFGITGKVLFLAVLQLVLMYFWLLGLCMLVTFPVVLLVILSGGNLSILSSLGLIVTVAMWLVFAMGLLCLQIRYCFTGFHLAEDPGAGAWQAMKRGVAQQRGYFGSLLKFHFSFFPWLLLYLLLSGLSTGVTMLFNYHSMAPSVLNFNSMYDLMSMNIFGYCFSLLVDVCFLLKFLPLYYVSLASFYLASKQHQNFSCSDSSQ